MKSKSGKCSNFGNCATADARATVEVPGGLDFVCNECGKPLLLSDTGPQSGGSKTLARAGTVAGHTAARREQRMVLCWPARQRRRPRLRPSMQAPGHAGGGRASHPPPAPSDRSTRPARSWPLLCRRRARRPVPHKRLDPVFHFPAFDMKNSPDSRLAGIRTLLVGISAALLSMAASAESIVTGGRTGTYYAIGSNLRDFVNPTLEVKDSKGSWANVEDMSQTRGVTLAIVQSDVYSAFVRMRDASDVPQATRREYAQLLANLRVFMPLYQEEIHFLVRKDEPIEFIHQIRGKPIWMDMEKSGTYLTALNVYSKLFQERPNVVQPFINTTATGDDEGTKRRRSALMALSDPVYYQAYPKIDVLVLVGGQPLGLLEKNVPANLKLLKFDPTQANSDKILQEYRKADIRKSSYPLLNMAEQ
jgi:TRAP-type uncharacterized transport system substrate-binding protein